METNDFSQPIRQSPKGIIVIFGFNIFKFFKQFFLVFAFLIVSILKRGSFGGFSVTSILLIILGLILLSLVFAILKYLNFKFHIQGDEFHLSTGIFNKENIIVPKSKIQNVYIKQNFLQQFIDVVSLNIETAGDKKSEIEISALDKPTALKLKNVLFSKRQVESDSQENIEEPDVFFKASIMRLLLEGLSQNHLKSFAIIASFVMGLYFEFEDYLVDFGVNDRLEDAVNIENETAANLVLAGIVIMIFVLLLSLIFSVIRVLIVNFNLTVIENKKTIEINKGLFNKVSLSLTPNRIQNLVISTNRLKRFFNLHTLAVQQAMTTKKQQKNFVIVALERLQLAYLVNKLLKTYSPEGEKHSPLPYYKRILALRTLPLLFLVNLGAYLFIGNYFWLVNVIIFPFIIAYVHFAFKKAYFIIRDDFVTVGSGFIDDTTNILEIHKLQAIHLKQTIFQKRRQIASVGISTASKTVTIPYIQEKDAQLIYDTLLFKVESQNRDWM